MARFRPELSVGYLVDVGDPEHLRVMASARCVLSRDGRTVEETALRFSRALDDDDRQAIAGALPYAVHWEDRGCGEEPCRSRALARLGEDGLVITRPSPARADEPGEDVRASLAARSARMGDRIEVTAVRVRDGVVIGSLERTSRGVSSRIEVVADEGSRRSDLEGDRTLRRVIRRIRPRLPSEEQGESGDLLDDGVLLSWASIEAALADMILVQSARLRRSTRARVVELGDVDLDEPEALRQQADARLRALRTEESPERRAALSGERARLLARLFELTSDASAAAEAIDAALETGATADAYTLARRALALALPGDEVRRSVVRAAAATDHLAEVLAALRPDLDTNARVLLAGGVLAADEERIGFDAVEQSFATLVAEAPPTRARAFDAELQRGGLAEALYVLGVASGALGVASGGATAPARMSIRIDGGLRADGPELVRGFGQRWPGTGNDLTTRWASVAWTDLSIAGLRALSSAIVAQLADRGEATLSSWVTGERGTHEVSLRVALEGDRVRVQSASLQRSEPLWQALARDVLRPSMTIEAVRFPAATLTLGLSEVTRARVAPRIEALGVLRERCSLEASTLRCSMEPRAAGARETSDERGAEGLLDVLVELARLLLE